MTRSGPPAGRLGKLHQPGATRFLWLLLAGDVAFLVLDTIATFTPLLRDQLLSITLDGGYPELYQYVKFGWILLLLSTVARRDAEPRYVAWIMLFAYLGLDDAAQLHEGLGARVVEAAGIAPILGLRAQDIGELIVSAVAGTLLLGGLAIAFVRGSADFRQASRDLLVLLLLLVFFGVVVDVAAMWIDFGAAGNRILAAIEDWGEMVALSLVAWYAFWLNAVPAADRLRRGGLAGSLAS